MAAVFLSSQRWNEVHCTVLVSWWDLPSLSLPLYETSTQADSVICRIRISLYISRFPFVNKRCRPPEFKGRVVAMMCTAQSRFIEWYLVRYGESKSRDPFWRQAGSRNASGSCMESISTKWHQETQQTDSRISSHGMLYSSLWICLMALAKPGRLEPFLFANCIK